MPKILKPKHSGLNYPMFIFCKLLKPFRYKKLGKLDDKVNISVSEVKLQTLSLLYLSA